jgi:aminopeptidase N
MKKTLICLLSILWMAGANAQDIAEDAVNTTCNKAAAQEQKTKMRGDFSTYEDLSFDLKYYRFEWLVDPEIYAIAGTATTFFEVKEDLLNTLEFNLSTQLTIDAVKYHGTNITFVQSGDYGLSITLPVPLALGIMDSLSISYHGVPPSGGFGSFIQDTHNGIPVLWTLSEPFGSQDWWPCKNGLTDKVDSLDIIVTTPAQYRVASNGSLISETTNGGSKVFHWKHQYPIAPYLVAIAVTNYAQYTDIVPLSNGTQMPMLNYVYPESLAEAQIGTANQIQVLQFYDSLFVTYPFFKEKYGHAQFGWGGGMEHQTMSFVVNYGWGLLSHELAHQWFGDMVTCGSWEDIWLNEGFATFLEGLTRERFQPGPNWLNWRQGKINSVISQDGGSVRVDDTTSVNRIFSSRLSYNKGSYLLHMLRWKLGDEAFFKGIRNYLNARQFNYAQTSQLKTYLATTGGQNLDEYFNDWFEGQGFPSYQLTWSQDNNNQLFATLGQTTSHPSVPFFEMPVPVKFSGQGQDTVLRLEHTFSGQAFSAQLPFKVTTVAIDPDLWLISANNTVQQVSEAFELPSILQAFEVMPNPAIDHFLVLLETVQSEQTSIVLRNALGEPVSSGHKILQPGRNEVRMDRANLPAGTYTLCVLGADWLVQKQVVFL